MALQKGFLQLNIKPFLPSKGRIFACIALSLLFAFLLYSLMWVSREALRYCTVDEYYNMIVLTNKEAHFFDLIFSFISVIFAQSLFFTLCFSQPRHHFGNNSYKIAAAINEQRFFNLSFFGWFARMGTLFGAMFCTILAGYNFHFYTEYKSVFTSLVVVLFLQQWVAIRKIFKRQSLKWMLCSAAIVSLISIILSHIQLRDTKNLDEVLLNHSVYHNYYVSWPSIEMGKLPQSAFMKEGNIYVVNQKNYPANTDPVVLINNTHHNSSSTEESRRLRVIDIDSIASTINRWRSIDDYDYNTHFTTYSLKINANIKMAFVNRLKKQLAKANVRKINCAVLPTNPHYGYTLKLYDDLFMIGMKIPSYYANISELAQYKTIAVSNKIVVVDTAGYYLVNNFIYPKEELRGAFIGLIEQNPDYVVEYHISDNAEYTNYISLWVAVGLAIESLREQYIQKKYGITQDIYNARYEEAVDYYPLKLVELPEGQVKDLK